MAHNNHGPVYNQAGRDINVGSQIIHYHEKPDPLQGMIALEAAFNAPGKTDDTQCLPNTRVQVLQQIRTWVDGDDGQYIFWLSGWAGTGKSTIARTIAHEYYETGFMASFFFSRGGGDVSHAGKFVGTIASQLAQRCTAFKSLLDEAISKDKDISSRARKDQWNALVQDPLSKLEAGSFRAPLLLVIDALDECENESDLKQILHLLSNCGRFCGPRFRVFITSRPDVPVQLGFRVVPGQDHLDFVLHDISKFIVDADISAYLQYTLSDIRLKYSLGEDWPGEEAIQDLVRKSAGLFIWASTAGRFIDGGGVLFGPDRLSDILEGDGSDTEPEEELNNIYTKVLKYSIGARLRQREKDKFCAMLREALGTLVTLFSPLPAPSLAQLLDIPERNVGAMLGGLHSILSIPRDSSQPITLHHPSLRDFLLNSQRCRDVRFWVDEKKAHEALANHCMQLMSKKLKMDICGLRDPGATVAQASPDNLRRCLPAELQYACRYWVDHLQRGEYQLSDDDRVHCFLRDHLLHWVEALSWIEQSSHGIHATTLLQSMVNSKDNRNLYAFLHDAKRFLLYYRSVIEQAPLQLYCSALAFAPQKSEVRKQFEGEMANWIKTYPQTVEWSSLVQTLEGHTGDVRAVVFSPDGKLIASASDDGTVRLWDAATGAATQTLKGHNGKVLAVVFAPNGKLIASASDDGTVRLWDAATGAAAQTLEGHTNHVLAVVFSPNGKLVASASHDNTVRLWDAATGAATQTFEGHTNHVLVVVFSPDGKLVASASNDDTVRLWDAATGAATQTFEGCNGYVREVVFSPNGKLVASASNDRTVRLWDAATGAVTQTLKGHIDSVLAIVFSPNGKLVATASYDTTIRLWDAATGVAIQTLEGHAGRVSRVGFSPDGKLVASSSNDCTVRLWDAATGAATQTFTDHTGYVREVVFSPDGKLVASASDNCTVRLWDAATGAATQTLKDDTDPVRKIVFSPNGRLVASHSDNCTVRFWNAAMGTVIRTLEGHTGKVLLVVFSPNSKLVASASDRTVRLWDAATGTATQTLEGHTSKVSLVVFSPDSKLVASASHDHTVRLWDAATGAATQTLEGHPGYAYAVVFSPDSKLVASASYDHIVRLWDAATGAATQTLKGHTSNVLAVVFSPNGKLVASASYNGTIQLWDAATGAATQILTDHTGYVRDVVFSPDGKLIASALNDGTVRLWDTATGAATHTFENMLTYTLAFSNDGLCLHTDNEFIQIDHDSRTPQQHRNTALLIKDDWIMSRNTKLLWLPLEYRPSCSAFREKFVALGFSSGLIQVIEFPSS